MYELRKDILTGRWVEVISEPKAPQDYDLLPCKQQEENSCVLCPGHENEATPEIAAIRTAAGWQVRAIPSFRPMFQIEGELGRRGVGIYDRMNSIGANEILIESPDHKMKPEDIGLEQMMRVITLYRDRIADLEKDSRLRYILIYKDSGREAGEIFSHPVSFLMATPVIPKMVKDELDSAKQYFSYKERCIFCDIITEELRLGERIILETKYFIAFCPYAAQFPFESWIIPKRHSCAFNEITYDEIEDMGLILMTVLKKLRKIFVDPPFNYVIHTAPNMVPRRNHWHTLGEDFHWHLEIMPRLVKTSGFEWGSGFYILPTSPENAAKYLKGGRIMQIKSILFPTDFSEGSSQALQYAVDMTKKYGAKLYVVHVIYDIAKGTGWYVPHVSMDQMYKDIQEGAKKELEKFGVEGLAEVKDIERTVLTGVPHEEVMNFAKKNKIDLIIMGTHGRKGIDRILFGSTAAQIVRFAPCPVLTVRLPMY